MKRKSESAKAAKEPKLSRTRAPTHDILVRRRKPLANLRTRSRQSPQAFRGTR